MSPENYTCAHDSLNCRKSFEEGTEVTLTAQAEENSIFAGWDGNGCSGTGSCVVTMNSPLRITANFNSTAVLEGDINGDEVVDLADVIIILQIFANSLPAGQELNPVAALNAEDIIGLADAIVVLNLLAD